MSSALLEIGAPTSGQLCFDWLNLQQSPVSQLICGSTFECGTPATAEKKTQASRLSSQMTRATATKKSLTSIENVLTQPKKEIADASFTTSATTLSHQRGKGEVRIGSLMIKLLKSYGITDAEIQAGLELYALKNRTSIAS